MTTTTVSLKPWRARVAGAALAFAALLGAGAAQARGDVYWSLGVQAPGMALGVANAPPVMVASGPGYYAAPPVYYAPRPIYHAAPVYVVPSQRGHYSKHHYKHRPKHHHKHRGHGHRGHGRH